jgi:PAS domain S-box-containing protein
MSSPSEPPQAELAPNPSTSSPFEGPTRTDLATPVLHDIACCERAGVLLDDRENFFRAVYEKSPVGICLVETSSGRFLRVNPKYCELTGRTEQDLLTRDFFSITHPDDLPLNRTTAIRLTKGEIPSYELEKRYVRPDGTVCWVHVLAVNLPGDAAQTPLSIGTAQDITDRKLAQEAHLKSEARARAHAKELETILDVLPIPVLIARDPECRDISANRAGRELFRVQRGANLSLTAPPDQLPSFRLLRDGAEVPGDQLPMQIAASTGRSLRRVPTTIVFDDGTERNELANAEPLFDDNGNVRGAVGASIDVTELLRTERELRSREEHLRLAQSAARIGTFERDFVTGEVRVTDQMAALLGLAPADYPKTIAKFLEAVHPQDREEVRRLFARSEDSGEASGEWRVVWPDGTVHWILASWRVFKDAAGRPLRLIGADLDITDRKRAEEELRLAKERLNEQKLYLEQQINTEFGFEEIIGQSKALKAVMESVAKVASSDATVLLLGETGTGKELVARAIHRLSRRSGNAFIKMNCAAIPSGLLESELFGNERGAFTGAIRRKIGRLELADKGTIFLDEVGEIDLALQPKLLRVLQDQEFERLGGTQTLKVNFRLIAATNRDLTESVRANEFRRDLYYRLNVFPISLPPLRERREDIPFLAQHFVRKIAQRMNKSITSIPKKTMDALANWNWPGNVRELENFVERSVILTFGSVLAAPLGELESAMAGQIKDETLKAAERDHILQALERSRGRISGPQGAATRLGMKRTTLQSKLNKMGINPRRPSPGQ